MSLLLAGIDEAGYGPMLGPLCVGMTLFRVRDWAEGQPAPDLWRLLRSAVCRKPSDTRRRIPIADSKQLKLANDCKAHHPLVHLERGVMAFLRAAAGAPAHDDHLFEYLGVRLEGHPWYGSPPRALPLGCTDGELAIAASRLAAACESAGVELLAMRCIVVGENVFNQTVARTGSKAEATALAVGHHLREIRERCTDPTAHVRIVGDQLGGRTQYEELLARELPGASIQPLTESEARSRYQIAPNSIIQFMPEAESAHLPVALASMVAKLVRELAMMRFNAYWCGRVPELRPTAGYNTDARRWLDDMRGMLQPAEREALVRVV